MRLEPLPHRNALFAGQVTVAYMHACGEGVDPPYGALVDLVRNIQASKTTVYQTARRLRTWRI